MRKKCQPSIETMDSSSHDHLEMHHGSLCEHAHRFYYGSSFVHHIDREKRMRKKRGIGTHIRGSAYVFPTFTRCSPVLFFLKRMK